MCIGVQIMQEDKIVSVTIGVFILLTRLRMERSILTMLYYCANINGSVR